IPFYIEGPCVLKAALTVNNSISQEASSKQFSISRNLKGDFEFTNTSVQLGKIVEIKGNIFKLDGTGINGSAVIYFMQGNSTYAVDTVDVSGGKISYSKGTSQQPAGDYEIQIDVLDSQGNQDNFTLAGLKLISDLKASAGFDVQHVLPGKEILVEGSVRDVMNEDVEEGVMTWDLAGSSYSADVRDGKFSSKMTIANNFKTGTYNVQFSVADKHGNRANTSASFFVDAVPTSLTLSLSGDEFNPEEQVGIKVGLYDQAGDVISENIETHVLNPDGEKVFSDIIASSDQINVMLPKHAEPGNWKVKAFAKGLDDEKILYVKELKKLDFELNGSSLAVTNVGNVVYNEAVKVRLSGFGGNDVNIVRKVNLEVGEMEVINLAEGIPTGAYAVYAGDEVFENVDIEGVRERNYSWIYYILVAIVIFTLIYLIMSRHSMKQNRAERREETHRRDEHTDENFRERIQRDIDRNMIKREPVKRADTTPTVPKKDFLLGSYSKETIFGRKRKDNV
ncbi:MAG: hypothetical protein AABW87_02945, partial [Nanoarchaeota archaeon]